MTEASLPSSSIPARKLCSRRGFRRCRGTAEAKFATALDNLEVQIQHNLADFGTWEPIEYDLVYTKMDARCSHDVFLTALCNAVKAQAEAKMVGGGIDVASIRARLAGR